MGNEHTDYKGEVDVPAEAIQVVDPAIVTSMSAPFCISPYVTTCDAVSR